jgi:uncharacterized membrane protein
MNVHQKLRRWRDAGLIDEATHDRIAAFEQGQSRPVGMYALIGLGASTVGLGLVSLVAANWDEISPLLKLIVDFALGAALALGVYWSIRSQRRLAREALITIFYGFTLASLALVGQIYQLDSPAYQALLTWSLATLPLCLLGESLYLAVLYSAGFATSHVLALEALFDALGSLENDALARNIAACVVFVSPLAYVLLGFVPWLRTERPAFAWSAAALGGLGIVLGGTAIPFLWYERLSFGDTLTWSLAVTLLLALGFGWALTRLLHGEPARKRIALASVVPVAWLLLAFSCGFRHGGADYIAGILQIAWLGVCALVSYRAQWPRLFNALTALIALRILVVYFEVFGSLLDTGVGLVTGGVLTLLIAWFWQQKVRQLALRARDAGGASAA